MNEKSLGISQQTLVSYGGDHPVPAKKLPQYIASLASTIGALATGLMLGWTSAAGKNGIKLANQYNITITPDEFSWIGSLATIGAALICIPTGVFVDLIGRKYTMLVMAVPFTVGWLLLIFADSVLMFYIGRFITGIGGGCFCIATPMYAAEISENEIRGALGSYFQLLLTIGILLSYILGAFVKMQLLSIISGIVPLIFFAVFMLMPESPIYYLKKGRDADARESLVNLRGALYNVDSELQSLKEDLDKLRSKNISYSTMFKSKVTIRSFIIAYGLMIFQQLSGVNAIIFYSSTIFTNAGSTLDPEYSTIIVGVIQVVAVLASTILVDRLGRRILLLLSIIFLFVTLFILGIYFYLQQIKTDVSGISWLPLVCLCLFICLFNFGFGPLPWAMLGEIFAPEVKGLAASSAGLLNSVLAFLVTKFYSNLQNSVQDSGTFWLYSAISAVGILFVYFIVPETKGKSLEQIQSELDS